ncbi:MAG: exonuclease domain-containing protein [Brotaphodocola sp.]
MKNYIVFDLEWNQSSTGKADSVADFPFEIIEIGAVKLDEQFHILDEFHRLIHPQVYMTMHHAISEVTHMSMDELFTQGVSFVSAARDFLQWCGPDAVFCSWGSMDLTELQRNMRHYNMENPFPKPLFYYDIQKLYALFYRDGDKPSLDTAVQELGIQEERPFHRAADDAWYTGKILEQMNPEQFLPYMSIDYYRLPDNRREEIHHVFPDYYKYVSRTFPSKEDALKDRAVPVMRCYRCNRVLRKKIRWFTPNQKIYYALAICPEHGFLKGKIRIKKADEDRIYVVKTLKLVDEEEALTIFARKEELRKKRAAKSRAKKKKLNNTKK